MEYIYRFPELFASITAESERKTSIVVRSKEMFLRSSTDLVGITTDRLHCLFSWITFQSTSSCLTDCLSFELLGIPRCNGLYPSTCRSKLWKRTCSILSIQITRQQDQWHFFNQSIDEDRERSTSIKPTERWLHRSTGVKIRVSFILCLLNNDRWTL